MNEQFFEHYVGSTVFGKYNIVGSTTQLEEKLCGHHSAK
jgi:hypothetical protein